MAADKKSVISVGVPAFNQGRYLRATLDSLLSQTVPPFEIVVSDNHSTDETARVLGDYSANIRIIRPSVHLSMMAHWNYLVANLHGEWISLLSSDDIARPNYVKTLTNGISRSRKAVLVRCGWENIDGEGSVLNKRYLLSVRPVSSPPQTLYEQICGPKTSFASFAIRRSAWERVGGFPERCTLAGDWGLWLRLSPLGDFVRESKIISQYRNDYRPELQKSRIVPWLNDEFVISTEIIPDAARRVRLVDHRKIERKRVERLLQCLGLASRYLDSSERGGAIEVFRRWADKLELNLESVRNWNEFVAGKTLLDDNPWTRINRRFSEFIAGYGG